MESFDRVVDVMNRLRSPGGCPWDREQTHASLRRYVIEEAYEVADAIDRRDARGLCEELGDLLLQVVFHARLAEETGEFDTATLCERLADKLIRRHPHVFATDRADTAAEVEVAWEARKLRERGAGASLLDGIPRTLPALLRAWRLGDRAATVGFDWPEASNVLDKFDEERLEFDAALVARNPEQMKAEFGDLLLTLVSLGRKLAIDPEAALREATDRFDARFRNMETQARNQGVGLNALDPPGLDALWRAAKASLESGPSDQ